jgi:hypothetical protein
MSEAAYFPESWPLIFDFFTFFISFYVGSKPNLVPEPEPQSIPVTVPLRQKVTVPLVPVPISVPAPQH